MTTPNIELSMDEFYINKKNYIIPLLNTMRATVWITQRMFYSDRIFSYGFSGFSCYKFLIMTVQ